MGNFRLQIFTVFLLSLAARLVVFFYFVVPPGDSAEFGTFVREIAANGGFVPSTNTLYFPGSPYIYPPLLFLATYWLGLLVSPIVGTGGILNLQIIFLIAVAFSSLTSSLIYWFLGPPRRKLDLLLRMILLSFFSADLFALTWGGLPYIVSEFFFVLVLVSFMKRGSRSQWMWIAAASVALIAFLHDLTYFVTVYVVLVFLVFDLVRKDYPAVKRTLIPVVIGGIAGVIWWLPRIQFIVSALTTRVSSSSGPIVQGSSAFSSYSGLVLPLIVLVILIFLELNGSRISGEKIKIDYIHVALISSAVAVVFLFLNPAVTARYALYSLDILMIGLLLGTQFILPQEGHNKHGRLAAVLLATVLVLVPVQFLAIEDSARFYTSSGYSYDSGIVSWAEKSHINGTVIAPYPMGDYLSSIDGVKVIPYDGYYYGVREISLMSGAAGVIMNSTSNQSLTFVKENGIDYIVVQNTLINSSISNHRITFPYPDYKLVISSDYYTVYLVTF